MLAVVTSAATRGIDGYLVRVEVNGGNGLPAYNIVGLPDAAVRESRERVAAALQNAGFQFPPLRLTVNLAPAGVRKAGPAFDLPIALGILVATDQLRLSPLGSFAVVGELSLDGAVRPVRGALCLASAVHEAGVEHFFVPADNAAEAAQARELSVHPVATLRDFVRSIAAAEHGCELVPAVAAAPTVCDFDVDLADVRGQERAKRALEIAAAGGHHVLLIGPPGSGKTMLARRLPTILPPLGHDEAVEVTKVASVAGLSSGDRLLGRPFRAPHHTISVAGLAGGGQPLRPGEMSLAHHGVLFLDELPEFRRAALEVLRQPLEEGAITLARANETVRFPSRFTLVCSLNPCPCGYLGDREQSCRCAPGQIAAYRSRLSGPLLDRIDLHVEVGRVATEELLGHNRAGDDAAVLGARPAAFASRRVRDRVCDARRRAAYRLRDTACRTNAELTPRLVRSICKLDDAGVSLLRGAVSRHRFSARACHRLLKVARTIADLAGDECITVAHVAEAVMYRSLDRTT